MAIKISLGKLSMPEPFDHFINEQVQLNQISLLSFTIPQIAPIATLPFHHRDPFDRMLVAQALSENLPVLSRDAAFDAYSVQRIW
ncbi:MAG: type II toxin-antitoxin system VapC family toxin [Anaerolineae bacterium]